MTGNVIEPVPKTTVVQDYMPQSPSDSTFIKFSTELKKALLGCDITAIRIYDDAGGGYVEYIRKEQQ